MSELPPVVLLTPLAPDRTGNGLAMRAGMLLSALRESAPVLVVVVPVAGPGEPSPWAQELAEQVVHVPPIGHADGEAHVRTQLADPRLRAKLEATAPLPARTVLAPPSLAGTCADALGLGSLHPRAVVGFRLPLAPLAVELARVVSAERIVIDVDDDDEALLHDLGDHDEAAAHGRLARAWLPDTDTVLVASVPERDTLAGRHALGDVRVVPNTVTPTADPSPLPRHDRLLFVGNLTYRPNLEAARRLADRILPAVRAARPIATLDLVGAHRPGDLDDLAARPGVRVRGFVDDLAAAYAEADLVVAPLTHGAGTRIKLLEAFAHGRPVVATAAAASGLEVTDAVHLVLAESDRALARATVDLLTDRVASEGLANRARDLLETRYAPAIAHAAVQQATFGEPTAP